MKFICTHHLYHTRIIAYSYEIIKNNIINLKHRHYAYYKQLLERSGEIDPFPGN